MNSSTVILTLNDIESIIQIENACFSVPWSRESFIKELQNPAAYYVGAACEEELAAYGGLWQVAGEGHITNIAVLPRYRRRGLGKHLLENMICFAGEQKLAFLTLEVRKSNLAAIGLYAGFGFVKTGLRKNYYADTCEDADIMTLYLEGHETC